MRAFKLEKNENGLIFIKSEVVGLEHRFKTPNSDGRAFEECLKKLSLGQSLIVVFREAKA